MNTNSTFNLEFAYALGKPEATGQIRTIPEDFQVDEVLGFEPDGNGEHAFIKISKRNTNTEWLARQLASFAGVAAKDVSFSGLKDRNAVTTQWFSVWLPGKADPDWQAFSGEDWQVIEARRHSKKLRRGVHKANRFSIVISNLVAHHEELQQRLELIKANGVPNYFGEQRFGHDGDNLKMAEMMLLQGKRIKNRNKRSIYLSAARSWFFNLVCSARVEAGNWNSLLDGEALMLSGSHSYFVAETIDEEIEARFSGNDVLPTGPLWGRGTLPVVNKVAELEHKVLAPYADWLAGLEQAGLKQERRALSLPVNDLEWRFSETADRLELSFELVTGSFATSVLRELINY